MAEIQETSYSGHDNEIDLVLRINGSPADLSVVTRFELEGGSISLNSDDDPAVFDWTAGDGKISLSLGSVLDPGRYAFRLIAIDQDNPNGIVWDTVLKITSI